MRPTVHDIAKAAGVSLATVDRVLNQRPGVRAVTRARVNEAIESLGFVRDMAAANLAKGRTYRFVFVVPDSDNSFMAGLRREIDAARGRSALERTDIAVVAIPAFDAKRLAHALENFADDPPDGVTFVAIDAPEVLRAATALRENGIAVATLVSDLPETSRDHFAGVDNLAAGRTAGNLIGNFCQEGIVATIAGSMMVGDHRDRLQGFRERISTMRGRFEILPIMESQDDPEKVFRLVSSLLDAHPHLAGLYNLGAGNRGLIRALEALPAGRNRPRVVVHELTPFTRKALTDDLIDGVLNQDPGHEVRSAIRVLKATVDGIPVIADQERIRIDIFVKDNLP